MSGWKAKRKRSALKSRSSSSDTFVGLFKCYNFLTNNEYSDKTVGLPAFILRKLVNDINISDIIDKLAKQNPKWKSIDFIALLENIRYKLPKNESSIEKCLMLNRVIKYIQEDKTNFMTIISSIQTDMETQMTDNQLNQTITYPEDFRQREKDFNKRRDTQNIRRLFYFPSNEAKVSNFINLQNRTTLQLTYLIDNRIKYNSIFFQELKTIFSTSFMIIAQPHYDVNPVLVYDRKGPGEYTAKVSVIIISLLHDFMETHPNMIRLDDIEPSFLPTSPHYKLSEPQSIPWKTRQLQINPNENLRTVQYAELLGITIQQLSSTNTSTHLGDVLHTFNFPIKLRMNLTEPNISKIYQILIESLPFLISTHTNQVPHYLTRVIIDDIRRFSQPSSINVKIMLNFLSRYFIHRTGVEPKQCLRIYLEEELTKALDAKTNHQSLEDIFMDFLVPFVHQVEFMAKHPVLAMFHADGLFLGSCNSEQAANAMMQPSNTNLPIVALRFNSIRIDDKSSSKAKKDPVCSVRVVIYNTSKQNLINCTFDSSILSNDIYKFISSTNDERASYILFLSGFDNKTNNKTFQCYKSFNKYYDDQLKKIAKSDPNYKHITDLFQDIEDNDDNHHVNENQNINSYSLVPVSMATIKREIFASDDIPRSNALTSTDQMPLQNVCSHSSNQELLKHINDEDIIEYIFSCPSLCKKLEYHFSNLTISSATATVQQQQQQSYSSQLQMHYSNQQTSISYQQQPSSGPIQIHLQMPYPPQQQSSSIMPNQPINANICQQFPVFPSDSTQIFQISENCLTQPDLISDDLLTMIQDYFKSPNEDNQDSLDCTNFP